MIEEIRSNRLECLSTALADRLASPPPNSSQHDVFLPSAVAVSHQGIAHWLRQQLSMRNGVAFNLDFPLIGGLVWRVLNACLKSTDGNFHDDCWQRDSLHWALYKILQLNESQHSSYARYLEAGTLASLYDQYLYSRPELIQYWQSETTSDQSLAAQLAAKAIAPLPLDDPRVVRQGDFWRCLHKQNTPAKHRVDLLQELSTQPELVASVVHQYKSIHLFLTGPQPAWFYQLMDMIGQHCELYHYQLNPGPNYYGDIPRMQQALQAELQDSEELVDNHDGVDPTNSDEAAFDGGPCGDGLGFLTYFSRPLWAEQSLLLEHYGQSTQTDLFRRPQGDTVLGSAQAALFDLDLSIKAQVSELRAKGDRSLTFHRCHSRLREVQVAKDLVMDFLARHPQAQLSDVLIMSTAIEDYLPEINAVWGVHSPSDIDSGQAFFINVGQRQSPGRAPVAQLLIWLLQTEPENVQLSDLVLHLSQMHDHGAIDVELEAIEALAELLASFGAMRGIAIGEVAISASEESQGKPITIDEALDALYEFLATGRCLINEIAPEVDLHVARGVQQEVLGILSWWVECLRRFYRGMAALTAVVPSSAECDIEDGVQGGNTNGGEEADGVKLWAELSLEIAREYCTDEQGSLLEEHEFSKLSRQIRQGFSAWEADPEKPWFDRQIALLALRQALSELTPEYGFMLGGVSFCSLQPLQAVPAKQIILMGQGVESIFLDNPADYQDLLAIKWRPGDRHFVDQAMTLFLQTVLAARTELALTFVGWSEDGTEKIVPNQPTRALLSLLTLDDDPSGQIYDHPLRVDSHQYNASESILPPSYDTLWLETSQTALSSRKKESLALGDLLDTKSPIGWQEVSFTGEERLKLTKMKAVFGNPLLAYARHTLHLHNDRSQPAHYSSIEQESRIDLNSLQSYSVTAWLLDKMRQDAFARGAPHLLQDGQSLGFFALGESGIDRCEEYLENWLFSPQNNTQTHCLSDSLFDQAVKARIVAEGLLGKRQLSKSALQLFPALSAQAHLINWLQKSDKMVGPMSLEHRSIDLPLKVGNSELAEGQWERLEGTVLDIVQWQSINDFSAERDDKAAGYQSASKHSLLLRLYPGKRNGKRLFDLWVDHLLLQLQRPSFSIGFFPQACSFDGDTIHLYGNDMDRKALAPPRLMQFLPDQKKTAEDCYSPIQGDVGEMCLFPPLASTEAQSAIAEIVQFTSTLLEQAIAFEPDQEWRLLENGVEPDDDRRWKELCKAFFNDTAAFSQAIPALNQKHPLEYALIWGNTEPSHDQLTRQTLPGLAVLQQIHSAQQSIPASTFKANLA